MWTATTRRRAALAAALACAACPVKKAPPDAGAASAPAPDAGALAAHTATTAAAAKGPELVEVVDGVAVIRVGARRFDDLSQYEKIFAYWAGQAAMAGDPITYDQRGPYNLAVKELVEQVLVKPGAGDAADLEALRAYAKKLWIHKGVYDSWTSKKFVPKDLDVAKLEGLVRASLAAGGKFERFEIRDDATLARQKPLLEKVIFDPAFQPTNTDGSGYYAGVTVKELKGFKDKYPLNSRIEKKKGKLVETPYRSGDEKTPPGAYAKELERVRFALRYAIEVSSPLGKAALRELDTFFRTGEPARFDAYNTSWVKDATKVDAILGFIESYGDPRGMKGEFEGAVLMRDEAATQRMRALAKEAPALEALLPWKDEYKRSTFDPPVAAAFQVLAAGGAESPSLPQGINLPNDPKIREKDGSKSFLLTPVIAAGWTRDAKVVEDAFLFDASDRQELERCGARNWESLVALHEVTGHGSGKVKPKAGKNALGEAADALEEARADLVALHLAWEPKLVELGLFEDARCAASLPAQYVAIYHARLRHVPEGTAIVDDHLRSESLIVNWAREKGAVEVKERDGVPYLVVSRAEVWRSAIAELAALIMKTIAEGDRAGAEKLIARYGAELDPKLRDEAVRRFAKAGVPPNVVYLAPRVAPVRNEGGTVVGGKLITGLSLEETALVDAGLHPLE